MTQDRSSEEGSSCPFGHGSHPMKSKKPVQNTKDEQKLPEHLQNYLKESGEYIPESLSSKPTPSSIPRLSPTDQYPYHRWNYPSPQRFYLALKRKGHMVSEEEIDRIVSIHNTVNENTWREVLRWELNLHWNECQDFRLEKFQGRPKDLSPKAWIRMALGFKKPFDRHDWTVNRCGEKIRYIIDFYEGRSESGGDAVHLDVRPEISLGGFKDRIRMAFKKWAGSDIFPEDRMNILLDNLHKRESNELYSLPTEDNWNDDHGASGSLMTWKDHTKDTI